MAKQIGDSGTEQFTVVTRVDGNLVREQLIHDPFLHNRTVVNISRWDLLKALFRRQFTVTVEVSVKGSEGMMRRVMSSDPEALAEETQQILEERQRSRQSHADDNYCHAWVAKKP